MQSGRTRAARAWAEGNGDPRAVWSAQALLSRGAAGVLGVGGTSALPWRLALSLPPDTRRRVEWACGGRSPYHVRGEDEDPLVLAAGPPWVVQEVGVILQRIPCVTPCMQRAALTHHEPPALANQLLPTQASAGTLV